MSSAAIGLLGVVAGTVLAAVFEYSLRRRNERRESRVAARLLRDAFTHADERIPSGRWPSSEYRYDLTFAADEWREHRAVLARSLTNAEWNKVVAAATADFGEWLHRDGNRHASCARRSIQQLGKIFR